MDLRAQTEQSMTKKRGFRRALETIFSWPGLRSHLCWRGLRGRRRVALTFDDGPDPEFTPAVLNVLAERRARATFFLVGERVDESPELVQQILGAGHAIGNHGYDHRPDKIVEQMRACRLSLHRSGVRTKLVRPPAGRLDPGTLVALWRLQCSVVLWSFDAHDSMRHEGKWRESVDYDGAQDGDIILLHDDNPVCVSELPGLLDLLDAKELSPVTVQDVMGIKV